MSAEKRFVGTQTAGHLLELRLEHRPEHPSARLVWAAGSAKFALYSPRTRACVDDTNASRAAAEKPENLRIPSDSGWDTLQARIPASNVESIRSHFAGWDKNRVFKCTIYGATLEQRGRPREGFSGARTTFDAPNSASCQTYLQGHPEHARLSRHIVRDLFFFH